MNERFIATVDLGSYKTALTVAKVEGRNIDVIYYKDTPSDGIRRTAVFNPQKASMVLSSLISEAESELGIKITNVATGLPRYDVRQETARGKIERTDPDASITVEEIEALKNMAMDSYPVKDIEKEIIYGAVAQSFSTEDQFQAVESDIIGMTGATLEGNFKEFIGSKKNLSNINAAFKDMGISCLKFFLPDVTAKAILCKEDMENGVALVDIGAGATSVTIYENSILRHYACIPFGGNSITSDIRTECGLSAELAENIKLGFGICMPDKLQSMSEKVLQINNPETGGYQRVTVKLLSEIITARMREIIEAVLYEIQESGFADRLRNGIVITGGAAELANCANFFKDLSGYKVRRGYTRKGIMSSDTCPQINMVCSTSSAGLLLAAAGSPYFSSTSIDSGAEAQSTGNVEETAEAEDIAPIESGQLFSNQEMGTLEKKPRKPRKERASRKSIMWSTLKSLADKADNKLEGLYDETEK